MAAHAKRAPFVDQSFATRGDSAVSLAGRALQLIASSVNPRLLDLGCGSGGIAIEAARMRPDLSAVALDVSPANTAAARAAADAAGLGDRVMTVCADYMQWSGERFDVIVSDSVLYVIEGDDAALAARLVRDLRPGGFLVAATPVESAGNTLLILLRRLWRLMPLFVDRFVFALARRLYPRIPPDILEGRIPYLRVLPVRLFGPRLAAVFAQHGLQVTARLPWDSPSIAKLKHELIVWRRP
jgi:SAM-dependent methyltransferase